MNKNRDDIRLIEAGFPCHQVGAETQRERGASSALPPLYYLHVWWARRPLTPSRAAVLASLAPAGMDGDEFVKQLGIVRKRVLVGGQSWILPEGLLERIERVGGEESLFVDGVVRRAYEADIELRRKNLQTLFDLAKKQPGLDSNPSYLRWMAECSGMTSNDLSEGVTLTVSSIPGDPAWAKERIAFETTHKLRTPEDKYGYGRAYAAPKPYERSGKTVLDPTSGGGSIPFEALRLGHNVIANELNPVALTILNATLDFPARFGPGLIPDIERWGERLVSAMRQRVGPIYVPSPVPAELIAPISGVLDALGVEAVPFRQETLDGYLLTRQVTCPHCGGAAPLLNSFWLSREEGNSWGVRVVPDGQAQGGKVAFAPYRVSNGRGPSGEDPNGYTVSDGVGQCVHCKQAIDGEEIKAQAQGSSRHGTWIDRVYCVVAIQRLPKVDKSGRVQRYATGARAGQLKIEKLRYFRPANEVDLRCLDTAKSRLRDNWDRWDELGLVPTEAIPEQSNYTRGHRLYGITRWCDMFTPRQLLCHLEMAEELTRLIPSIVAECGESRGRAVSTYLQFVLDKIVDYNSRFNRWIPQRCSISGTFSSHNYSLKWTFAELISTGAKSGAAWALSQVLDAYKGICELVEPLRASGAESPPLLITNGSAANLNQVADESVDLVCMDPPYFNNVQYAELSDFYYVWQKRTLKILYPELYTRRLTNKTDEAVANPARDGSNEAATEQYGRMMQSIFAECRRVVKTDGLMTLMFTHKEQTAWEAMARSLIEAGWEITSSFPVESEFGNSTHQLDQAAAASSIFVSCRKRREQSGQPSSWTGVGGSGVARQVREAVVDALRDFEPLKLNPVDRMVASYGRALQVLSRAWPVVDGNELVAPTRAMNEAARVVAQQEISRITDGRLSVDDLDPESATALTLFGIFGLGTIAFDEANNVAKSLNVRMEAKAAGYRLDDGDRMLGYNQEATGRRGRAQASDDVGYHAPVVRKGSKLRLALPSERSAKRLERPQSLWDVMQGALVKYDQGDIPVARAYLESHAKDNIERLTDLLEVWALECGDRALKKAADGLLFGLRMRSAAVA